STADVRRLDGKLQAERVRAAGGMQARTGGDAAHDDIARLEARIHVAAVRGRLQGETSGGAALDVRAEQRSQVRQSIAAQAQAAVSGREAGVRGKVRVRLCALPGGTLHD